MRRLLSLMLLVCVSIVCAAQAITADQARQKAQAFVIISGDEQTEAVLGYSDEGTFDAQNIPSNLQAWLDSYARQVEDIASGNVYSVNGTEVRHQTDTLVGLPAGIYVVNGHKVAIK